MSRPFSPIWISLAALAALAGEANAQAVTEYDSEISKSATTANKGNHISGEIRGVWGSLDKTLKTSHEDVGSQEARPSRMRQRAHSRMAIQAASRPPAVAATHEDPTGIQPGIGYAELVRRFGRPDFEVTAGPGTTTLTYFCKDGSIDLELQDGKVVKVAPPKAQEITAK